VVIAFQAFAGCKKSAPYYRPAPAIDAVAAGAKAIELFDANKDGKISGAELDKCPALKTAFEPVNPSDKLEITAAMIAARIKDWQDSKLGRVGLGCIVLHNGQPLKGAEVKFVPENFLDDKVPTATGKTDAKGTALIGIPDQLPLGITPGFYRVEITKTGENIPAKYNTETIFGLGVPSHHLGMEEGLKYDLKY
jgi:hypothetical protein